VAASIGACLERQLTELDGLTTEQLLERRYQRLLAHGQFTG
jgi:acetyl-CoA carboxylase alpha subunit